MSLDDLLEELDLDEPSAKKSQKSDSFSTFSSGQTQKTRPPTQQAKSTEKSKNLDDIDALLDDLDSVSPSSNQKTRVDCSFSEKNSSSVSSLSRSLPVRKGKCLTIFLGGSRDQQGMGPGYACDRLRCSKCDFNVLRFADTAWSERCDYLFFRNFFPDPEKLSVNMEAKKGEIIFFSFKNQILPIVKNVKIITLFLFQVNAPMHVNARGGMLPFWRP